MSHSFKSNDGKYKVMIEEIDRKLKSSVNPNILKFNEFKIEEKIMDSLNSLKYGFILIMAFVLFL